MNSRRIILSLAIASALVIGFNLMMDRTDASDYIFRETPSWKDNAFSEQAQLLFLTLKARGIDVRANQQLDFGQVDLVIEDARLFIQVDDKRHFLHKGQASSNLWDAFYALEEDYFTLRVPDIAVEQNLEETVEVIRKIVALRQDSLQFAD